MWKVQDKNSYCCEAEINFLTYFLYFKTTHLDAKKKHGDQAPSFSFYVKSENSPYISPTNRKNSRSWRRHSALMFPLWIKKNNPSTIAKFVPFPCKRLSSCSFCSNSAAFLSSSYKTIIHVWITLLKMFTCCFNTFRK